MIRALLLAAWLAAGVALAPGSRAEQALISLSTERIAITSNFTGASLVVFGVIDREGATTPPGAYDVVVTVRGPRGAVVVREKERRGPFWLNADSRKYIAIPALLSVLSNRPLADIASEDKRRELRIGVDNLVPSQGDRTKTVDPDEPDFRRALIRIRKAERLFVENPEGVKLITRTVFRANARIPGAVPLGAYAADVAIFQEGREVAKATANFTVTKSGVEEQIAYAARFSPLMYALATIAAALMIGWLASIIFRRD